MTDLGNKTDEEFKSLLEKEYGWIFEEIVWGKKVPKTKPEYVEQSEQQLQRLRDFLLHTYIINDGFDKDHNARVQHRRQLEEKYPGIGTWIYNHNKLGGNNMLGTNFDMDITMQHLKKKFPEKHKELSTIFNPSVYFPDAPIYNSMDFAQKVVLARKIDNAVYNFLVALSK